MPPTLKGPTLPPPIQPAAGSMQRDFEREQNKMNEIGINPMQLGSLNPTDLYEATYTPEELAQLSEYQSIKNKQQAAQSAEESLLQTPRPTSSGMRILENALREKGQIGQAELGTSELFEAAGLSGYAVLNQSMAERSIEIGNKYTSFANELQGVAGALTDTFQLALDRYTVLQAGYDKEVVRFQKVVDDLIDHEQSMAYLVKQNQLNKDLAVFKAGFDGKAAENAGKFNVEASLATGGTFANRVTGTGTVTGLGSPAWKYGLDIAIPKGSAVVSPQDGIITEVVDGFASVGVNNAEGKNQNKGFGNQIKVQFKDGSEMWFSHLDSTNPDLFIGKEVTTGQLLGNSGNTGYTMGQNGNHIDLTMKDKNGDYISPENIKKYIEGELGDVYIPGIAGEAVDSAQIGATGIINKVIENNADLQAIAAQISENEWEEVESIQYIQAIVEGNFKVSITVPQAKRIYEALNQYL